MRSVPFTILLLVAALICGGLAAINLHEGDLTRVFGAPATPVGETLYDFDPQSVREIGLLANEVAATCAYKDGAWQVVSPWEDRMDPRIADALLGFTLTSWVEGAIPTDKVESMSLGFDDSRIAIRIEDDEGEPLAKYILRSHAAWLGTDPETGDTIPTVYVQPRDRSRKDYIYVCTDPVGIHGQLGDGLRRLRDHHPFLYHPYIVEFLQGLRIKTRSGELTLSRNNNKELWSIAKPIELKTDAKAIKTLVTGLYKLEAVNVRNRSEVTLPGDDPTTVDEIALRYANSPEEVVLTIYPPETPESPIVLATVSDRPNAVFELPRKKTAATNGSPGLADLPLSVNDLRDPTLTSIDPDALRGVLISPAGGQEILLGRERPGAPLMVEINGVVQEPNEDNRVALEKAVTELKVADFVSDTVTDLAPYGLDKPFLTLRFLGFDNSVIQLDFGRSADDTIHAIRQGTTSVVEIDPTMLGWIATTPQAWRDTRLWRIGKNAVKSITRRVSGQPPLSLDYNDANMTWSAYRGGTDHSAELATDRAEIFLDRLLSLRVTAWLAPDDADARRVLASPEMVIELQYQQYDDETGDETIRDIRRLTIARGEGRFYFGMLDREQNLFLLAPEAVEQLSIDLFSIDD